MSDFDGVDFFENAEQMESKGPEVAPTGEYEAKIDRKSTRLNSSHSQQSRMPSSA